MPRVRNVSGEALTLVLPSSGQNVTADADAVVEVPADDVESVTANGLFESVAEKKGSGK